ncbi:hypothetical protein EV714DRAFT_285140 [Schizophyllum commune]
MAPFSKPETVLKQAEGLVSVGQSYAALQSLTEMFSSKRFRSTPLTSLEPIMNRFIELCVELRKGRTAKEGLMQYKNIAQNTSVQSIEAVVTRFIQLADNKVKEAQEKAATVQVALDVDDLEASETPESILLGAVSGDQSKDRTDRALVTPWLKFLWESYRTSLETLKNNARLETIYQQVAQQAFKFCLKHQRKVEFRRLCETLRLHLANVAKYAHQTHSINLSDADTLQHHLDTRFAQLNTSVELELWQEAFRSVEDIHNLLTLAKKAPRPAMMANYYEKLTRIFLMSGNALYHAAAWGRYYSIVSSIGGKSEEEMSRLAGQVLVSALAVPVGLHEVEEVKGKNARLTALLGLSKMPTRAGLLKDALARDVLRLSPQPVKDLYNILEVTFDPLSICKNVAPLLDTLSKPASDDVPNPYASYLPLLHRALLSRLLSQLGQIYSTIHLSTLHSLVEPLGVQGEQVESFVVGCAHRGELGPGIKVRVDHIEGCVVFSDTPFVSGEDDEIKDPSSSTTYTKDTSGLIQTSVRDLVRTRLSGVAECLYKSLNVIEPPVAEENTEEKFKELAAAANAERKALQLRRAVVHRRRELLTELTMRKEKEDLSRRAELTRKEREAREARAKEELKRKEAERTKKEIEEIRAQQAKEYAKNLVDMGILKPAEVDKLETYDTEQLITIQVGQLEKEKKEMNERLTRISKRIDHIERAYRKEERPLLAKDYEQQQETDRRNFEALQEERKTSARQAHEEAVATKKRLLRMREDYEARRAEILARKGEEFSKRKEAAARKIEEEKAKRRKAVLAQREEERKRLEEEERIRREQEEEEMRLVEERIAEENRLREEAEAKAAAEEAAKRKVEEEAAARRAEREKERQAAAEQARLQREREEEAERRRAERRAAERAAPAAASGRPSIFGRNAPAAETGGNAWRRSTPVPERTASPAPAAPTPVAADAAPAKYRPGALGGGGGWRAREQAKAAGASGTPSPRPASPAQPPASPAKADAPKDDDGFQTVASRGVWRPRRGRA